MIIRLTFAILTALLLCTGSALAQGKPSGKTTATARQPKEPMVAYVNGAGIPYRLYDQLRRDQSTYQQRTLGATDQIDPATDDALFVRLVNDELTRQLAAKMGISVTRDQAMKQLLKDPPDYIGRAFVDSMGSFHRDIFETVVLDPRKIAGLLAKGIDAEQAIESWKNDIDKTLRFIQNQLLHDKLAAALYAKDPLSQSAVRNRYFAEKTILSGSFVRVLHSTFPDTLIKITEPEARAYYAAHKDDYKLPPSRTIASVVFGMPITSADSAACRARMDSVRRIITAAPYQDRPAVSARVERGLLPDRLADRGPMSLLRVPARFHADLAKALPGDVIGPVFDHGEGILLYVADVQPSADTLVRARHVLVKYLNEDSLNPGVFKFMSLLRDSIKNSDSIFLEAVKYYSQDGSRAAGGDLGYFRRGQMLPSFDSAAFAAAPGTVVGPVRTSYGFHLIRVLDRVARQFVLRELRFPLQPSAESRGRAMDDARLMARALRSGGRLDSLVRVMGRRYPLFVSDTTPIRQMEMFGDIIGVSAYAFGAAVGDVAILDLPFDRLGIVKVLNYWKGGTPPFEDIPSYPYAHALRVKQLDSLRRTMDRLADSLQPEMLIGPLRSIAPMAEVFLLKDQAVTAPPDEKETILDTLVTITPANGTSRWVRGKHGYYFLRITQRNGPTDQDYQRDRQAYTRSYTEKYREKMLTKALDDARAFATLQDLRPVLKNIVLENVR